jgi:Uma2 family endonuclease
MRQQSSIISRWITASEFHRDRAFERNHYILDGEVFTDMGNAHRPHEIVKARLHKELILHLSRNKIEAGVFSETAYELGSYTVLIPDVSVQIPERPSGPGFFMNAPEIAFEILSPANSLREIDRKARAYWEHGANAVWVIDPDARRIFTVDSTGEWIAAEVIEIAGISVDAMLLWPEPAESP